MSYASYFCHVVQFCSDFDIKHSSTRGDFTHDRQGTELDRHFANRMIQFAVVMFSRAKSATDMVSSDADDVLFLKILLCLPSGLT